jgi:hypothetical protein
VGCCVIWGHGGILGCSLSLSVVVLLLQLGVSLVGGGPMVAQQACQDGKGSQFVGRSRSSVAGCSSCSTSWHKFFLFYALWIQLRREPWLIWTVGIS